MPNAKTHLSVIHPQREAPVDIAYKTSREFAFCHWCTYFWEPTYRTKNGYGCENRNVNPNPHDPERRSSCYTQNPDGRCIYYAPNKWTRFIRLFGFRKPVQIATQNPQGSE